MMILSAENEAPGVARGGVSGPSLLVFCKPLVVRGALMDTTRTETSICVRMETEESKVGSSNIKEYQMVKL